MWKDVDGKRYIPPRIAVAAAASTSGFSMTPLDDDSPSPPEGVVYEVRAMVVQVRPSADEASHLISFVKGMYSSGRRRLLINSAVPNGEWFVFNDFLVRAVSEQEALSFAEWKVSALHGD